MGGGDDMTDEQFTAEIADIEGVIKMEIQQGLNQKQIAQTYALGLRSSRPTDWRKVNRMIVERWSTAGLVRIKKMAWLGSCFPPAASMGRRAMT